MSEENALLKRNGKPKKEEESDSSGGEELAMEGIRKFFEQNFHLSSSLSDAGSTRQKAFEDLSFDGLCKRWNEKGFKNIITMVGAGISTSAGIPDFRSPGSGLYDNLQKYNLPHPTAIFELDYFYDNPQPFFTLAKELYPGTFNPTPSHYFVRLLNEKGLLKRHYTQNIDTLDRIAGIPDNKLVEAHGTFYTNHCLGCRKAYSMEWMKKKIFSDHVPACEVCNAVVKPDIVFFGENLPEKFYVLPEKDFKDCDLLIIMGTSLEVHPFASLTERVGPNCVRLLINRTMVKSEHSFFRMLRGFSAPLLCGDPKNTRDVAYIGDCDDGVLALAKALGWEKELHDLIEQDHKRLAQEAAETDTKCISKASPQQSESMKTAKEEQNDDKPSVSHAAAGNLKKSDDKKVAKDSK